MTLTLDAPPTPEQIAFNKMRWREVLADPELAKLEWRVETDRHGRLVMSPPPKRKHGKLQFRLGAIIDQHLGDKGTVITECPVCTSDGVKGADIAWISDERDALAPDPELFSDVAPEICVEVLSPANTKEAMEEKKALYFAAGAEEVWFCRKGKMEFYLTKEPNKATASRLCPDCPSTIKIRRG